MGLNRHDRNRCPGLLLHVDDSEPRDQTCPNSSTLRPLSALRSLFARRETSKGSETTCELNKREAFGMGHQHKWILGLFFERGFWGPENRARNTGTVTGESIGVVFLGQRRAPGRRRVIHHMR